MVRNGKENGIKKRPRKNEERNDMKSKGNKLYVLCL